MKTKSLSLRNRVLLFVNLLTIIGMLLLGGVLLRNSYHATIKQIDKRADDVAFYLQMTTATLIWNFDTAAIEKIISEATKASFIDGLSFFDKDKKPMAQKKFEEKGYPVFTKEESIRDSKGEVIGYISVVYNKNQALSEFKKSTKSFLLLVLTMQFFISLGTFLILRGPMKHLQEIVEGLNGSALTTSQNSMSVRNSSVVLSKSSEKQAAAIEETVTSIQELSSIVQQNSEAAQKAAQLSNQANEAAQKGQSEIQELISSMDEITTSSSQVAALVTVIDDIAFQTNLLALNAAVEAARAGEQGRGFAVVAEAVRTLALSSAKSAKEISTLMNETGTKIGSGNNVAKKTAESFQIIADSIFAITTLNQEIANASKEQSLGISEISRAMNDLDATIQQNAGTSNEVATASDGLSKQAESLTETVKALDSIVSGTGHQVSAPMQAA